jgi:hypothetical protein
VIRRSTVTQTKGETVTRQSIREYLAAQRVRYEAADRATRHDLLDEMVAVTEYHRKAIIRHLRQSRPPRPGARFAGGGKVEDAWEQFEKTGRIEWVTDLAEIPAKYGVTNVHADLGQIFAQSTVADPRVCAAMLGQLIRGLGVDHVVWGTDAIWTGSPQWQIEAMRRLEIPEDMQKKHGFQPLGPADGRVKTAIFGGNNARIYNYTEKPRAALATDRIARLKEEYQKGGGTRSNLRYGYVVPARA